MAVLTQPEHQARYMRTMGKELTQEEINDYVFNGVWPDRDVDYTQRHKELLKAWAIKIEELTNKEK